MQEPTRPDTQDMTITAFDRLLTQHKAVLFLCNSESFHVWKIIVNPNVLYLHGNGVDLTLRAIRGFRVVESRPGILIVDVLYYTSAEDDRCSSCRLTVHCLT